MGIATKGDDFTSWPLFLVHSKPGTFHTHKNLGTGSFGRVMLARNWWREILCNQILDKSKYFFCHSFLWSNPTLLGGEASRLSIRWMRKKSSTPLTSPSWSIWVCLQGNMKAKTHLLSDYFRTISICIWCLSMSPVVNVFTSATDRQIQVSNSSSINSL